MDKESEKRLCYIDGFRDSIRLLVRYLQAGLSLGEAITQCGLFLEAEHGPFITESVDEAMGVFLPPEGYHAN